MKIFAPVLKNIFPEYFFFPAGNDFLRFAAKKFIPEDICYNI